MNSDSKPKRFLPWFLLLCALFLYFVLFVFPATPIFLVWDQTLNGMRMLDGMLPYRDFYSVTPPGLDVLFFLLFKLFGLAAGVPNLSLLVTGVLLAWLSVRIASQVLDGWDIYLPGLLFLVIAYRGFLFVTHHWFSLLALLAAVFFALRGRTIRNFIWAGIFLGLSAWFTQVRGLAGLAALLAYLTWEWRRGADWREILRSGLALLLSFAGTITLSIAYFAFAAGIHKVIYWNLLFGLHRYSAEAGENSWRAYLAIPPGSWAGLGPWLLIQFIQPLVYAVFLVRALRGPNREKPRAWDSLILLSLVGFFQLLSVVTAPAYSRLSVICVFAFIILIWLFRSEGKLGRMAVRLVWVVTLLMAVRFPIMEQYGRWHETLQTPAGTVVYLDHSAFERHQSLLNLTRPGEYFFEGKWGHDYLEPHLRSPAKVPFVSPTRYSRPEDVADVIAGLEKHQVRIVLWPADLDQPPDPREDPLGPLRAYLRADYRVINTLSDGAQIWERNR